MRQSLKATQGFVGQAAFVCWFAAMLVGCAVQDVPESAQTREVVAAKMSALLKEQMLERWYPRVVDTTYGGYLSRFNYRWEPEGPQQKMVVTQARHVWTAAKAALWLKDDPRYQRAARHGVAFLENVMWDQKHGGFYHLVTRQGEVIPEEDGTVIKQAYGNAFAIYGLAAFYEATGDTSALHLAQQAFRWLETHSHDPQHKGYFQFLQQNGTALTRGYNSTPPKDQNSSIHLLEAFTQLYKVWPDPLVRQRLEEMLYLIRDTMVAEPGYLRLFFARDWTPVSYRDSAAAVREAHYRLDHVSFGHDVETAYLLLEADQVLGLQDPQTRRTAQAMVRHALAHGWDGQAGGFYDQGYYMPDGKLQIIKETKNWWAQAEALNTLLLAADEFPDKRPWGFYLFEKQWSYVKTNLIDTVNGGWYDSGLDKEPAARRAPKSHIWKGAYHTTRSLINCIERLSQP